MFLIKLKCIFYFYGFLLLGLPQLSFGQLRKAIPVAALNSGSDELMPVMAPDGKRIYFVRSNHPENTGGKTAGQDIWFSTRNTTSGNWQKPQNIGPPLNNIYHNAISSFSPNADRIWLSNIYLSRNRMAPGLSYTSPTATGWSKPKAVTIRNFTPEAGFINFFQATDSVLLLSMQADTAQMEDLYICRLLGPEEWSEPVNLGAPLNTPGFEIAPFLAPDGKTLYFTSNGHGGLGDADIFMSRRLDHTWLHWSAPVNLGREVNTPGFDGYFILDAAGEQAYFTSENPERGNTDIYFIRLADIFPAEKMAARPPATESGMSKSEINETGTWLMLPALIYFDVSSAILSQVAQTLLQNLSNQLRPDKNKIYINGHADDTGTETLNKKLSRQRAQAVADFLILQGLPKEAIRLQGYGSSQPVAPNQSAADRAKNRRVEIQIE